jgi:hypothetical protein
MKKQSTAVTCDQVREMDLVLYLASLGFEPEKIRGGDYWYLSPLRSEKTASFKVNRKINRWYDHGSGQGGNLIDFALLYHDCTIGELLQSFNGHFSIRQPAGTKLLNGGAQDTAARVIIKEVRALQSLVLIRYLQSRKIPMKTAEQFCKEVDFELKGKAYYSIGFANDGGGYELRNAFCKNSSSPKAITTLKNGAPRLAVLEGFFDFLSLAVILTPSEFIKWDYCVLNSLSFFEKTTPVFEKYSSIHLFLDNDTAGQNCSRIALASDPKYRDESPLYKNYKDVNEWHLAIGKIIVPGIPKPP